ncbi:TrkH family potassium uptake protein [Corynebacterium aurimucosum]|uniref:TrkH family potassium uptake protein n=1 Tax=Corynebacterium guaraldiae TaxID=3051103 RepID=A0ABY3CU16_9CORY|nr:MULTISPECIES: potassium transporter TrkG [Corynebacterium]MTE10184.1 TrkH family potassium uptake protein [Corynebacterium guaraldiae]TRX43288.1 TrkH family potassium uptake protein [Corynebacterium guaraldiae]TRX49094.1 TrkH family potassium uptake protein [Corynebacterium guaraldiae]
MKRGHFLGPARLTAAGFILLILLGTLLLMLPISANVPQWTPFLPAFFTATSAVSLTGLVVEDTGTYWTPFGQAVIIALIQLGGLGIMSLASLSGMLLTGRISFKARRTSAAEGRAVVSGGIRHALMLTLVMTLICEAIVAVFIGVRLATKHGVAPGRAVWEGIFHAISAFNNAGFSTYSDSVVSFAADAWILMPLACALITGGLGYPMLAEFVRRARARLTRWRGGTPRIHRMSMTARMTLGATAFLLLSGTVIFFLSEGSGVLHGMPLGQKLINAFFMSASPRTAGFNAIDYGEAHPLTLMVTDILMFIGGGSAGTAGGIKVTTACVLGAAMISEFLGREDTSIGHRRLPLSTFRQALALTAAGMVVVALGVATLRIWDPEFTADQVTFEVMSAFATVGLSTGITASLSAPSQLMLCLIMYVGRVGPTTFVAALAARTITLRYRYPEERPFIG